jgi:hypothetical protein
MGALRVECVAAPALPKKTKIQAKVGALDAKNLTGLLLYGSDPPCTSYQTRDRPERAVAPACPRLKFDRLHARALALP